ncbi:MAG: Rid family detoxifying hydrolase [Solitalea-like symbiont of Acarus siro]
MNSNDAPEAIGSYSQAIKLNNGMLFVSGQLPINPKTNLLVNDGIESEVHQIMQNIKSILKKADLYLNNILKASIFVKNLGDFDKINKDYGSYFKEDYFPARECVEVSKLPKNANIEISVIAYKFNNNLL